MGRKSLHKAAGFLLAGGLIRSFIRMAPKAFVGMTTSGAGVGYESAFVQHEPQPAIDVQVSDATLDMMDELEARAPISHGDGMEGISLFDATDSIRHVGVFPIRSIESITTWYWHHTGSDTLTPWGVIAKICYDRGLGGMSYHLGIERNGRIVILQPFERRTNHTAGHNSKAVAVVFLGNYEKYSLNQAQIDAAEKVRRLMHYHGIKVEFFHRDVRATACPGRNVVRALRHS